MKARLHFKRLISELAMLDGVDFCAARELLRCEKLFFALFAFALAFILGDNDEEEEKDTSLVKKKHRFLREMASEISVGNILLPPIIDIDTMRMRSC